MSLLAATISNDELCFRIFTAVLALHLIYALFSGRVFKPPVKPVGISDRWRYVDGWFLERAKEPFGFWFIWTIYLIMDAAFVCTSIADAPRITLNE